MCKKYNGLLWSKGSYRGSTFHDNSIKENIFVLLITKSRKTKQNNETNKQAAMHTSIVYENMATFMLCFYVHFLCPLSFQINIKR